MLVTTHYQIKKQDDLIAVKIGRPFENIYFEHHCHKEIYGDIKYTVIE